MRKLYLTSQNCLKQAVLITACLCLQTTITNAQTPAENLSKGVETYNALREYEDGLVASTLTAEQVTDVKTRANKGIALLENVIKEGNAAEIIAARYFKNNFKYEIGFVLGMKGENAKGVEVFKEIEREMSAYSAADFPIRYTYFDKSYSITWENFASTQAEYFTGYAEMVFNIGKYEDAVRLNRLALAHPSISEWIRYVALYKMLDLYDKNNAFLTEEEYLGYALQFIKTYEAITDEERKTIADNKYPTDMRGVNILLDKALKNVPAALSRIGEAALASSKSPLNEKTLQLFEIFYNKKQAGDANFHAAAETYARKTSVLYPARATAVAVSAIDRMAMAISATDCSGFDNIIEKYTYWKQTTKASEYTKKREECLANEAKARKKAEKASRRANRNFNLYAGAYMFPLLKSNDKRDYGGALNFVFKKTAWEFSYLKIKNNKENIFDLTVNDVQAEQTDISRWNGFYAHIHPKFFSKDHMYLGPLLGYAQKNFEPLTANVTNDADGAFSQETFAPKVTQYIAMLNMGGLALARGVGLDMYFGIGATYNQWGLGSSITTEGYTIDNLILENRKDQYFSVIVRVGLTMGLNFGRGNMK